MTVARTAGIAPGTSSRLLESYGGARASAYDELVDQQGRPRPHWRGFISALEAMTPAERIARAGHLDRRVRQTGIAYDIFSDPRKPSQRWQLDLLPILISPSEWRELERALIQRARLFDALLRDVYSTQDVLQANVVPPDLVFSDSAYVPSCRSILPGAGALQFYAADIARAADGRWRVIDNHTETNAGLGFALANRVVHTHVLGDLFKLNNAVRLAGYFQSLQTALNILSGRASPRIALLTPGPHHEDYFSHAYLARYLGYLLVEGSDLRTRGNAVYLKTLEGLKEVDLIVRCVDGRLIDPLELDPSGFDGPAGLLRILRRAPQLVVNPPGTALAQNRGLGGRLAGLAQALLGEDLTIADAPRIWLGDADARRGVLDNLDGYIIRQAQEGLGRPGGAALGEDPLRLSGAERDLLRREIELHGARLVAEEKVGFSTAPALSDDGALEPRPFAVRLYVAHTPSGYKVMPGGLAMTVDPERAVALSAPDGHTRDVWVLADGDQPPHTSLLRPSVETARVQRSQRVLQSRVADDLFWLGRYCERADWTMRVLRGALRRIEEDGGPETGRRAARRCLDMLLSNSGNGDVSTREPGDVELEALCEGLIDGRVGMRTLERTMGGLYRTAHLARDRLSLEAWQALSRFQPGDTWSQTISSAAPLAKLDPLDEGLAAIAAFNGLMHENMTRNYGWSFLLMGRRLERAYNLTEAVYTLFVPKQEAEEETSRLMLLLELADSFITYRSRYRLDPMLPLVLDLLLLDETNPRSLAYQLSDIARHMESLPDTKQGSGLPEHRRLIIAALTAIRLADVERLAAEPDAAGLEALAGQQLQIFPEVSNALARHYFNLMDDTPHRAGARGELRP